ncbi:MAG: virulence protein SciE type [Lentisphaerae bacterium]|nr:virulence protein SciE type [Lentisphaerota bacterium]MCP4101008.1 virulence protein SciE type [Lentisphaerota bacterium]
MKLEDLFQSGKLEEFQAKVMEDVRNAPDNSANRILLIQIFCLRGEWKRAEKQLSAVADIDTKVQLWSGLYSRAVLCEMLREKVFSGEKSPLVFGEPEPWNALLFKALQCHIDGKLEAAAELRQQAFEQAPALPGSLNGSGFEWVADADTRLGPMLEVIVNGKYFWMPFTRLRKVIIEEPKHIVDLIWTEAKIELANSTKLIGYIPTRYAESSCSNDEQVVLGKVTDWNNPYEDTWVGTGQRCLVTEDGTVPITKVRELIIEN